MNKTTKVFITVEKDDEKLNEKMVIEACLKLDELMRINLIPCQLKITSLPRRKGFVRASEIDNIEGGG